MILNGKVQCIARVHYITIRSLPVVCAVCLRDKDCLESDPFRELDLIRALLNLELRLPEIFTPELKELAKVK